MPVMDFYQILCYTGLKISKEGGTSMPVRGYKRKRTAYRCGILVFILVCALAWCVLAGGYLIFGGLSAQTFQSTGIARVLTALLSAAFVVSVWCLCRWVLGLLHIQPGWPRLLLLSCVAIAVSLFMAFRIPFSPCHDAYDMLSFLEKLLLGENTVYMSSYFAAFSSNHLTALIYLPFVKLFGNVEAGVRFLNCMLMCGSILLLAACCKKMFGLKCAEFSLIFSAVLFPYLLMVGPYIYLPAIFLAFLALLLYHCRPIAAKIGFLIVGGLLFTLRPMACAPILVYIFARGWFSHNQRHRVLRGIGKTAIALACFLLIKSGVGYTLYATNLRQYPNLDDSSMLWTLELGTRYNGAATGQCVYFPYGNEGFDEISSQFGKLWAYYAMGYTAGPSMAYEEIKELKNAIFNNILERTRDTILSSPQSAWGFVQAKYINYYSDVYRPYYYMPNVYAPDFGDNVYHHYEKRFFLYMNACLLLFYAAAAGLIVSSVLRLLRRRRALPAAYGRCAALLLGALAVSITAIVATEVGKRLMFDAIAVMFPVMCFALCRFATRLRHLFRKKEKAVAAAGVLVSAVGLYCLYQAYNITFFHNSTVTITPETVTIHFSGEITEPGYSLLPNDGEEIPLLGKTQVTLPNTDNSENFFNVRLPDGSLYQIAKLRRM